MVYKITIKETGLGEEPDNPGYALSVYVPEPQQEWEMHCRMIDCWKVFKDRLKDHNYRMQAKDIQPLSWKDKVKKFFTIGKAGD
jgi:hypothetical protein